MSVVLRRDENTRLKAAYTVRVAKTRSFIRKMDLIQSRRSRRRANKYILRQCFPKWWSADWHGSASLQLPVRKVSQETGQIVTESRNSYFILKVITKDTY